VTNDEAAEAQQYVFLMQTYDRIEAPVSLDVVEQDLRVTDTIIAQ